MSRYLRAKLNDHANGKTAYTMPSVWVGLSQTDPTLNGVLTGEPSGSGYARLAVSANIGATDTNGRAKNTVAMAFGPASGAWGSGAMSYWFTVDSSSPGAGNVLYFAPLTTPMVVGAGDSPPVPIGGLDLGLS
jgi:hypothetical protein